MKNPEGMQTKILDIVEDGDTTYLLLEEENRHCYYPVDTKDIEGESDEEVNSNIIKYIRKNNIRIKSLPHIENTSKALQYVFDQLCSSDNNMWFIGPEDDQPWDQQNLDFTRKKFETELDADIKKYKLENYIEKGDPEWNHPFNDKVLYTVYGGLQGKFTW